MIGIFDYGVGNLLNLKNAIDHLGLENCIVQNSDQLESCSRMLLPGVGAFAPAMEHLRGSGMFKRLQEKVESGMPLLGICLGAQLLLEESSEDGKCRGLGWIPGKVRRFQHSLKVPQIGWNQVQFQQKDQIFKKLRSSSYFYFVIHTLWNQKPETWFWGLPITGMNLPRWYIETISGVFNSIRKKVSRQVWTCSEIFAPWKAHPDFPCMIHLNLLLNNLKRKHHYGIGTNPIHHQT